MFGTNKRNRPDFVRIPRQKYNVTFVAIFFSLWFSAWCVAFLVAIDPLVGKFSPLTSFRCARSISEQQLYNDFWIIQSTIPLGLLLLYYLTRELKK